jgi:hypothetical protein
MHRQEYWESALLFWLGGGYFWKGWRENCTINDTRDVNECATYCIIHQLFPINTMRFMSASNGNLSIFLIFHPRI